MPFPTQAQVSTYVTATIAAFTGRPASRITDSQVLAKAPLRMDSNDLVHLATSLREYVKVHRAGRGTLTARDTKKDQQTVGGLATLVLERIKEAR